MISPSLKFSSYAIVNLSVPLLLKKTIMSKCIVSRSNGTESLTQLWQPLSSRLGRVTCALSVKSGVL